MGPELEKANRAAVEWLDDEAAAHLEADIKAHGRHQDSAVLLGVLERHETSSVTSRGFNWGMTRRLNASGAGLYWRGVEQGTRVFVGRTLRVLNIGGRFVLRDYTRRIHPLVHRGKRTNLSGARWIVTVKNPIVGYHFLEDTAREFIERDVYLGLLAGASKEWRSVLAKSHRGGISPKTARLR
jgi:hypothetical protein